MSLYYEASSLIGSNGEQGSLKARVYNTKDLKTSPAQLYAVLSEATKWSPILKEVIEKSGLLDHERKVCGSLLVIEYR